MPNPPLFALMLVPLDLVFEVAPGVELDFTGAVLRLRSTLA